MHTLEQLRSGQLQGATRLDLCADLSHFPDEIFELADTLEVLNLSGNNLSRLPDDLPRLRRLRILFCSDNPFETLPEVLGDCPHLEMVGFKANRIRHVPENALPAALRWLILTDNRIERLPVTLGARPALQKLMLAGNALQYLPESLAHCHNLQLLRVAANRLEALPGWLRELPRLAWLAFAGNPFSDRSEAHSLAEHPLPPIPRAAVELHEVLGQGASGIIHRAVWQRSGHPAQAMAAKLFKGTLTSDGLPHSEMAACIAAGSHPGLISVAGPLADQPGSPPGLLLQLIERQFQPLAGPPSLDSCTRDCYAPDRRFSLAETLHIAGDVASAVEHLHQRGILHGDLYAHNLLADDKGRCLLGDFGAASFFEPDSPEGRVLQRIEARAFGCLLEELLERSPPGPMATRLGEIRDHCLAEQADQRPDFATLAHELSGLQARDSTAGSIVH